MIQLKKGKYKIYHIPGKKIGCTTNIKKRVQQEQGYKPGEYEILYETDDIGEASRAEKALQKDLGYKEDVKLYKDLADLKIETPYGIFNIDSTDKIEWILDNVHESQYGPSTCYTYNKAMSEAIPFSKAEDDIDFNSIRHWADTRGIGDMVVVLTNLASLRGFKIEDCIKHAYNEIVDRTGKMINGTFVKDK